MLALARTPPSQLRTYQRALARGRKMFTWGNITSGTNDHNVGGCGIICTDTVLNPEAQMPNKYGP